MLICSSSKTYAIKLCSIKDSIILNTTATWLISRWLASLEYLPFFETDSFPLWMEGAALTNETEDVYLQNWDMALT